MGWGLRGEIGGNRAEWEGGDVCVGSDIQYWFYTSSCCRALFRFKLKRIKRLERLRYFLFSLFIYLQ